MNSSNPNPLYNTSFSLCRVSPLYHQINPALFKTGSLEFYARQLQDVLRGEILRGVQVGATTERDSLSRAGILKTVQWSVLNEDLMIVEVDEDIPTKKDGIQGMLVILLYDKIEYRAIFLRGTNKDSHWLQKERDGFYYFPLLLLKMPGTLRKTFIDFVSSTFDTRVSSLHLPHKYLVDGFEKYISDFCTVESNKTRKLQMSDSFSNCIKDMIVKIGFDLPNGSTSLKAIDIHIPRDDFARMIDEGQKAGHNAIFESIGVYLKTHLALDLWNPRVKISRITCAALIIGVEGKLKLTQPSNNETYDRQVLATKRLINILVEAAAGNTIPL